MKGGTCEVTSFRQENALKSLLQVLVKVLLQCRAQKTVHMPPFIEYGVRFVISQRTFEVMIFDKREMFEADHSVKFRRCEKTKAISSKGGHVNFLVLCMKHYQNLYQMPKISCEGAPPEI